MAKQQWYYTVGDREKGPVSPVELLALAQRGVIGPDSLVRNSSSDSWVHAKRVRGLFPPGLGTDVPSTPAEPRPSEVSTEPPPPRSFLTGNLSSKVVAVVVVVGVIALIVTLASRNEQSPLRESKQQATSPENQPEPNRRDIAALEEKLARLEDTLNSTNAGRPEGAAALDDSAGMSSDSVSRMSAAAGSDTALSTADVVPLVDHAIAQVMVVGKEGKSKLGSGFLIDSRGVLVTNYHVIEGASSVSVRFKGQSPINATGYVAIVPEKDLALLMLSDVPPGISPLRLTEGLPGQGEKVAAFGSPFGLHGTVSDGIISGIRHGREVRAVLGHDYSLLGFTTYMTWLQTTAPISSGNSGGPLVNMRGEVVGINTFWKPSAQNVNFAVAANELKDILKDSTPLSSSSFAELPPPRTIATLPPRAPAPPGIAPPSVTAPSPADLVAVEELERRIAVLRRIYEQRIVLIAQWENAKKRYQQLEVSYAALSAEYSQIYAQAQSVQQQATFTANYVASLRQQAMIEQCPARRAELEVAVRAANQDLLLYQQQFRTLDAHATRVNALRISLASEMHGVQVEVARLWWEAGQLRQEWLAVTDAFGKLERGEWQSAVSLFTEWIIMEPTNAAPYILRGLAYWQSGNESAARADFGKATQLDRRNAPRVIKALQEEIVERAGAASR